MAKILFFETEPWKQDFFRKALPGHELVFFEHPLLSEHHDVLKAHIDAEALACFIYTRIDAGVLELLPKLKIVATMSTGYDHLDLPACAARGVFVCNVPTYGDNTVAEHTFALILSLSREVHKSYVRTLADDFSIDGLQGFDLQGKTLGVVGCGKIGQHVIKIAKGFGMHVLVFDRKRDDFLQGLLHYEYADMDSLLARSDIVSLHVPATPQTHHLIGNDAFAKMKQGAILINTARGTLVDTDALYAALKSGRLAGAGLDVIEGEELIKEDHWSEISSASADRLRQLFKDKAIFRMDNVVFTPHNAFNSKEAIGRILDVSAKNLIAGFSGAAQNLVVQRT